MEPIAIGITALATLAAPALLEGARRWLKRAPETEAAIEAAGDDRVVALAYTRLVTAAPVVRRALLDAAAAVKLDPGALATIIETESGWDPAAPHEKRGTPRGGLIQVTVGAKLRGYGSADAVWGIRSMPAEVQLREFVPAFFSRFKGRSTSWTPLDIYKRLFLPADVGKPHDYHLGERGSTEPVVPSQPKGITRGDVYAANSGFDHGDKGYFTWDDVAARIRQVEARAHGRRVTVSGRVVDGEADKPAEQAPATPEAVPASPAPALKALLAQINAQWPQRSKASDGILGDPAHQARKSDHNDGNALDVTLDSARGPDLDALAAALLQDDRVTYVIYNHRIASRVKEAGAWRPYTGQNPHTRHLHVSIAAEARNDTRPWVLPDVSTVARATRAIRGLLAEWAGGAVDNVFYATVGVGPYEVEMATDALSVEGVRLPVRFDEVVELCRKTDYLPLTRELCDARWGAAARRVVLAPLGVPGSKELLARFPSLQDQAIEWSKRIGPKSAGELLDGPWKEWIVEPALTPGRAVNYGLRRQDGSVWQSPGHGHDAGYTDYSQLFAPVRRKGRKDGVEVDLLGELAKGAGPLGAGFPAWLVEALQ